MNLHGNDSFHERRREQRHAIYEGDSLYARIGLDHASVIDGSLRVIDISQGGIRLEAPAALRESMVSSTTLCLKELVHADKNYQYQWKLSIRDTSERNGHQYLGCEFNYPQRLKQKTRKNIKDNFRQIQRIKTPQSLVAYAFCMHPVFLGMNMCFQVEDITTAGALLRVVEGEVTLLNKRTMKEVLFTLQSVMPFNVDLRVEYIQECKGRYVVGVSFVEIDEKIRCHIEGFIYHLIQHYQKSKRKCPYNILTKLRKSGYKYSDLSGLVDIRFATTREERAAVYRMRYRVYTELGWIKPEQYPNQMMEEPYDQNGKLLMALLDGELIGCLRCEFRSNGETSISQYFDLDTLKPPDIDILIVSRLIVDKRYQSGHVLYPLFFKAYQYGRKHNIRYWFATGKKLQAKTYVYLLGFRIVGVPFKVYHGDYDYPILVQFDYSKKPNIFSRMTWDSIHELITGDICNDYIISKGI